MVPPRPSCQSTGALKPVSNDDLHADGNHRDDLLLRLAQQTGLAGVPDHLTKPLPTQYECKAEETQVQHAQAAQVHRPANGRPRQPAHPAGCRSHPGPKERPPAFVDLTQGPIGQAAGYAYVNWNCR